MTRGAAHDAFVEEFQRLEDGLLGTSLRREAMTASVHRAPRISFTILR